MTTIAKANKNPATSEHKNVDTIKDNSKSVIIPSPFFQ
jgi:hypothetical protein